MDMELEPSVGKDLEVKSIQRMKEYLGIAERSIGKCELGLDWKPYASRENVDVQASAVIGSFWQAIQGSGNIKEDKMKILALLIDDGRIGEYDDMFHFATLLMKVNDHTSIRRLCFKPIWPTAPRDFLCCTTWTELGDGSLLICSCSAPDDLLEVEVDYVRGTIQTSGYWIRPYWTLPQDDPLYTADRNIVGCRVTLTAHTDLGGTMPAWIVNMLSAEAPLKILIKISSLLGKKSSINEDY
jgi:hypothetical protein